MEVEVFSQLEIPAGEELTISYLPSVLLTLPQRQEKLAATWFFNCHCHRSDLANTLIIDTLGYFNTANIYLESRWLPAYHDDLSLVTSE